MNYIFYNLTILYFSYNFVQYSKGIDEEINWN